MPLRCGSATTVAPQGDLVTEIHAFRAITSTRANYVTPARRSAEVSQSAATRAALIPRGDSTPLALTLFQEDE